jgi:hypothetical protein
MGLAVHPDWKGHSVAAGVGGWWTGLGGRRAEVDPHRNFDFVRHVDRGAVHNVYSRTPERLAPLHTRLPASVKAPPLERRAPNTVFTDPHGEAYRKSAGGDWERHTPEGWKNDAPLERREPAPNPPRSPREGTRPTAPPHDVAPIPPHHVELERERQARTVGNQKAQEFHQNPPPKPASRNPPPRQNK